MDVAILLPAGGVSRLTKRLPNTSPVSKFIEIKSRNLTSNNKGKEAAFRMTNTSGVKVTGSCLMQYFPLEPAAEKARTIGEKQDRTSEYLKEINASLKKRLRKTETRLNIMDGVIKGMQNQMKRLNRRLNKVAPETGRKG